MKTLTSSSKRPYCSIANSVRGDRLHRSVCSGGGCADVYRGSRRAVQWALAGRNRDRLEKALIQSADALCTFELQQILSIEIIKWDYRPEPESLAIMCKQGVIVLNCVGPACIENGAHCIGITQIFFRRNYHRFDSIPADIGILHIQDHFKGTLTDVDSFLTINTGPEGGCGHDAMWQSAMAFADSASLRRIRKKFGHKPLPVVSTRIKKRGALFFSKEIEQYAVPFMGSDPSMVDILFDIIFCYIHIINFYLAYVGIGGLCSMLKTLFASVVCWFMVKFSIGWGLLTQFPEFCSVGLFSKTNKKASKKNNALTFLKHKFLTSLIHTPNLCWFIINTQCYLCGMCDVLGGVYTPGSEFARTTLIDHLNKHRIQFLLKNGQ
uniref:Saccharopine dehydrogenase b n=1 Tax=Cyprinus carpio TaxID=7962 RepID=A0A8C2BK66_CYPCA